MKKELMYKMILYKDKFGETFPLIQSGGDNEAEKHIDECMKQKKIASELYPDIYGSMGEKFV